MELDEDELFATRVKNKINKINFKKEMKSNFLTIADKIELAEYVGLLQLMNISTAEEKNFISLYIKIKEERKRYESRQ